MALLIAFLFLGALANAIAIKWRGRRHKKIILTITADTPQDEREMLYYVANGIQRAICIDRLTTTIWFMMAIFVSLADYYWGQTGLDG